MIMTAFILSLPQAITTAKAVIIFITGMIVANASGSARTIPALLVRLLCLGVARRCAGP